MLYNLKQNNLVLKWNLCRNDDSKSVYRGTKSPVVVSDEKVQANQDHVYFLHLYLFLTTKKIAYLLQIYIIFEMVSILKV